MSRDRTRTREGAERPASDQGGATDFDLEFDEPVDESRERQGESGGLADRIGTRARRLFAPRRFLLALALSIAGLLGGAFVPLPAAGLVGVFLATIVFGLVVPERRYAEAAVAGGVTVGASFLLDYAVIAFLGGLGVSLGLVGAGLGAVLGVVGTYFGRDLRHGLMREVP